MNAAHSNARGSARRADNVVAFGARKASASSPTSSPTPPTPPTHLTQTTRIQPPKPSTTSPFTEYRHSIFTLSVDHSVPGVGHYARLMSAHTGMSVAELVEAVLTTYEWPEWPDTWLLRVTYRGRTTSFAPGILGATERMLGVRSCGTPVGDALSRGCVAQLQVGEFSFLIQVTDQVAQDAVVDLDVHDSAVLLTAEFLPALDASGLPISDATHRHPLGIPSTVSVSAVNIALAGEDTVAQVMSHVQPELRELLRDGDLFEFVPLLQALDLERPANVSEHAAELLADAPVEGSAVGRAAAWSRILALSTLVDATSADRVSESFMNEVCSDGEWDAAEIREESRETNRLLALAGAIGPEEWEPRAGEPTPLMPHCSLVERLEMYRFLLQR